MYLASPKTPSNLFGILLHKGCSLACAGSVAASGYVWELVSAVAKSSQIEFSRVYGLCLRVNRKESFCMFDRVWWMIEVRCTTTFIYLCTFCRLWMSEEVKKKKNPYSVGLSLGYAAWKPICVWGKQCLESPGQGDSTECVGVCVYYLCAVLSAFTPRPVLKIRLLCKFDFLWIYACAGLFKFMYFVYLCAHVDVSLYVFALSWILHRTSNQFVYREVMELNSRLKDQFLQNY